MPEQSPAPYLAEANLDQEPLALSGKEISAQYALGLVNQTFWMYESWRRNNHDSKWQTCDMLYFGQVERKTWDGTNIPRASLAQPIVFDQVEAALPQITQALFGQEQWFDVAHGKNSDAKQAREVQDHLTYVLEKARDEYGRTSQLEFTRAIKQVLIYGNGGVMAEWDEEMKRPVVQWVDLRDIYVDPGTPTPSLEDAKSIIHRRLMSVDEIEGLRSDDRFDIPSKDTLYSMAVNRPGVAADTTKQSGEMVRRVHYSPGFHDNLPLPADKNVEVLVYWSKSRCIWVFNREWVAYNEKNPYGFIPYCFAPCYEVVGRFYGQSFPDVIGDIQLYIQGLRNMRLDELHLALQPPRVRKRGAALSPAQLRWRPGAVMEVENPKEDMIIQFPQGASANIGDEVMSLEISAEKRTGVNSLSSSGIPRPGNANRTLGGMQMQTQGAAFRLSTIVQHVENYMIIPLLYKLQRVIQIHSLGQPDMKVPAMSQGQATEVPATSFFGNLDFIVRGSAKMMTKESIAQVFPFLMQNLLQGPFIQELQKVGQTIDYMELLQMLQDATGVDKKYALIRPLTEQEKQAQQQPDPKTQMDMQKAQLEAQTREKMGQLSYQKDSERAKMDYEAKMHESEEKSAREVMKLMMTQQQSAQEVEGEKQKLQAEISHMVQKMDLEKQKALMDMLAKSQEHKMNLQQQQEKAVVDRQTKLHEVETQGMAQEAQTQQQLAANDAANQQRLYQSDQSHAQKLGQGMQSHVHKVAQNDALGEQKISTMRAMSLLSSKKPTSNERRDKKRAAK
jgi:hypothetical protein